MGKTYAVSTIFKGIDQTSTVLGRIGKAGTRALGGVMQAAKNASLAAGAGLAGSLALASRSFVDFDDSVTSAAAQFGGAFLPGQAGFAKLGKAAREIGASTEFSAGDAAKGLDYLAMAGFSAVESMRLLPNVVNLATVAGTDLASATDIASDALGAFGLMAGTAEQKAANLARLNDVLAKTTVTANTDLSTLFEAIQKGAPAFTTTGQSMETFNALAGVLANSGLKGSEAGTSLRNAMLRLARPTGEAAGVLQKLGVQTQDEAGNLRDVLDILADFESGLASLGGGQRTAALKTVFGTYSITAMSVLLQEGSQKLRSYREDLINSEGAAMSMAEVIRGSFGNQLKGVASAATEVGFSFLELFEKDIGKGLKSVTEWLRTFAKKFDFNRIYVAFVDLKWAVLSLDFSPITNFFGGLGHMAGRMVGAITGIDSLSSGIWKTAKFAQKGINFLPVYIGVMGSFVAIHKTWRGVAWKLLAVEKARNFATKIHLGTRLGLMGLKIKDVAITTLQAIKTTAQTAAQWGLNAALKAGKVGLTGVRGALNLLSGPVGWIIAGVAALTAGVIWMVKNWDTVGPALANFGKQAWGVMRQVGSWIFQFLFAPLTSVLKLVSYLPGKFGEIGKSGLDVLSNINNAISGTEGQLAVDRMGNNMANNIQRAATGKLLQERQERARESVIQELVAQNVESRQYSQVDLNIRDQTGRAEFGPRRGSFSGVQLTLAQGLQ